MTSLLDIGPITETTTINGKEVQVFGASPEGFFFLLNKFPQLQVFFAGQGSPDLTMNNMAEVAPMSIAYALALVTTSRTEFDTAKAWRDKIEEVAKFAINLSAHHQIQIFQIGLRLTFPEGFGPFMRAVEDLAESISRVSGKTASATRSSKSSRTGLTMDSRSMRLGKGAPRASSRH